MSALRPLARSVLVLGVVARLMLSHTALGNAAELESAHQIYESKLTDAKEGVQRVDGLLFSIVEVGDAAKLREATLQSRCLLRSLELLRQHASDPLPETVEAKQAAPTNSLLRTFPFLLSECRQINPRFATRNLELKNLASRVLVNRRIGKSWRYVTVLLAADFDAQVAQVPIAHPTMDETFALLTKRIATLRDDQTSQAATFMLRCGAIEDVLILANDESWLEFSLPSFGTPRGDSVELYDRWEKARELVGDANASVRDIRELLRDWPGYPPALRWLSRHAENEQRHSAAVNFGLLARIDERQKESSLQDVLATLKAWEASDASARGHAEYATLLTSHQNSALPDGFQQPEHPSAILVGRVWRTCGHINIPSQKSERNQPRDAARASSSAPKELQTASLRFHDAIVKNPENASHWSNIGEVLLLNDSPLAAIPFLTESMRLDPRIARTRLALANCYQRLGHEQLRRGIALSALLEPSITDAERQLGQNHLQEMPKTDSAAVPRSDSEK